MQTLSFFLIFWVLPAFIISLVFLGIERPKKEEKRYNPYSYYIEKENIRKKESRFIINIDKILLALVASVAIGPLISIIGSIIVLYYIVRYILKIIFTDKIKKKIDKFSDFIGRMSSKPIINIKLNG